MALAIDLALLSFADHSIITYGTFGVWGALLRRGGDQEVIMANDFVRTDVGEAVKYANIPNWRFLDVDANGVDVSNLACKGNAITNFL